MSAEAQNSVNSGSTDKRYFPRWEVANRVVYQLKGMAQAHEATTKDLSCTGACLSVSQELPSNEDIKLTVYLSDTKFFEAKGRITWIKSDILAEESSVGIVFSELSEEAQNLILNHAFEVNPKQLQKRWFEGWASSDDSLEE